MTSSGASLRASQLGALNINYVAFENIARTRGSRKWPLSSDSGLPRSLQVQSGIVWTVDPGMQTLVWKGKALDKECFINSLSIL